MTTRPTAVVTGASRGIGRAVALRLAEQYHVVAAARSEGELATLVREIEQRGGSARALAVDVGDADAVARAFADVPADVLVNNAGMGVLKPFLELTPDDWRTMLDVNVNSLYHVTRALLPGMVERGRGDVVVIGSLAGRNPFAGGSCYAGTKHFVNGFAESLMLEVRDRGVRVSVVMPGSVATHFSDSRGHGDASWKLQSEDVAEAVWTIVSVPRHAHVSRIEMRPAQPGRR
jgi:NADP-dependent 3-hydroxy acid dehydrogenase YdfG